MRIKRKFLSFFIVLGLIVSAVTIIAFLYYPRYKIVEKIKEYPLLKAEDIPLIKESNAVGLLPKQAETVSSLIIEEYPIDETLISDCSWHPFNTVAKKLPQEILKKREKYRESIALEQDAIKIKRYIEGINEKLEALGYRFVETEKGSEEYSFYKGHDLIEQDLHDIHRFSMDTKKQHFVFTAEKWNVPSLDSELVCVNGKIEKMSDWGFSPIWINDELWRIRLLGESNRIELYCIVKDFIDKSLLGEVFQKATASYFQEKTGVNKNWKVSNMPSEIIYCFFVPFGAGADPVINLGTYEKSWFLQLNKDAIIDGKSLCAENNYVWLSEFSLINNKPFYFFTYPQDKKKIRLSYNGKVLPVYYDWLGIYHLTGNWHPWKNDNMICFFAKRGTQSYYVEAGSYK